MANTYTYDVQQSGYKINQTDEKGVLDLDDFKREFRSFPWLEQVGLSAVNGGAEPTITVTHEATKTRLWVSIIGNKEEYVWLVGYMYPKMKRSFLGIGSPTEIRWLEIYVVEQSSDVETYFGRYFEGERESLLESLKNNDAFAEMEAQR